MEKNWKAALIFLCIFLAGGVAGGFVGVRIACTKAKSQPVPTAQGQQQPQRRPIDDWSKRKQKEFTQRLGLTPDQQAKIEILFQDTQTELRRVREHAFQQTAEITDRLDAAIMDLLSSAQRPKFEQMIKERQEQQKKAAAERAAAAAAAARNEQLPKAGEAPVPPAKQPSTATPENPASSTAPAEKASTAPAEPSKVP